MTSLEDSLCHSNNGLAGNYVIGGLRPQLDLVMAHWPRPSYAFQEAGIIVTKNRMGPGDTLN